MAKSKKSKQQQKEQPAEASNQAPSLFGAPAGAASFDSELDAFFKVPAVASAAPSSSKRKAKEEEPVAQSKKAKAEEEHTTDDGDDEAAEDDDDEDEELQEGAGDLSELSGDEEIPSDTDEDLSDSEEREVIPVPALPAHDSDGEELPVHESLQKSTAGKKKKFEDLGKEAPHIRDKRTLFLGNVPMEAIKSRILQKKLRKHILSFSPYPSVTRITSIRFRSVAFAVPTDDFDADTEQKKEASAKRRERTQNYKEALAAVEGKSAPEGSHEFLNPKQKRKVAFINQQLNTHANTVNAYAVIGHPEAVFKYAKKADEGDFDSRLTAPVLAALIAGVADGRTFEDRHLRVDLVKPLEPAEVMAAGLDKATSSDGNLLIGSASSRSNDPKRTIFVGNLDFEAKEEDLREFFEKLVRTERGEPPEEVIPILGLDAKAPVQPLNQTAEEESDEGSDDDEETAAEPAPSSVPAVRSAEWVSSVRIVRDKATQMGKGFAYVRFVDTTSVDEVMAVYEAEQAFLEQAKAGRAQQKGKGPSNSVRASTAIATGGKEYKRRLKFKGRPLRVSRCKATTGQRQARPAPSTPARNTRGQGQGGESPSWRSKGAPTPNGTSPYMASKKPTAPTTPTKSHEERATMLAKLGKDERAALKRADPDRQQRRMEKKQKKSAANRILKGESGASKRKEKVKLTQGVDKKTKTFAPKKGKDRPKSKSKAA